MLQKAANCSGGPPSPTRIAIPQPTMCPAIIHPRINGFLASRYPQRLIEDPENNYKVREPKDILPSAYQKLWTEQKPPASFHSYSCERRPLLSIWRWLADKDVEWAGIIGPAWFSANRGSSLSVPLTEGIFTWHSHTGDATFSTDDILIFLYSSAVATALFTRKSVATATKHPLAFSVHKELRKRARHSPGNPLLTMRRLQLCGTEIAGAPILELPENELCALCGIERRVELVE